MTQPDPREYLNDQEEAARLAQDGHQARIWSAMPAIIQSVNLAKMTCTCQIALQGVSVDQNGKETWQNLPIVPDVPIMFPSGGGFTISFPLKEGDEVLLVFAARCIDSWWQNGGFDNIPMEDRMHDLSDAFAIPGPRSQPRVVEGLSSANLQITSDGGTPLFSVDPSGNVLIAGNLQVNKAITAQLEITAQAGGTEIPLSTHIHPGVTSGSSNTGEPLP